MVEDDSQGEAPGEDNEVAPDTVNSRDIPAAESASSASEHRSRKRSDIWQFITDLGNGKYSCKCCEREDKMQMWNSKAHSTIRKHLKTYHKTEYCGDSDVLTSRQTDLLCYGFERIVKQRVGSEFNKADADKALVDWIVANAQPFALVEQPKFIVFCATMQPLYKVPVRQTIRCHVIKRWKLEKDLVRKTILRCLVVQDIGASRTSITTDMWTSAASKGYMVVTLHWIDENWNLRSVILGFLRVEYPHTGRRLADHLMDAVKAMDGSLLLSIWAITTDNAKNNTTMVESINRKLPNEVEEHMESRTPSSAAAMTMEPNQNIPEPHKVFQVRCLAHVLQLAVKEGLNECSFVDSGIGYVRDILKKMTESSSLNEELKRVCAVLNVAFRQPKLDCVTRWNSTWEMVLSAIHLQKPIEELLRRIRGRHEGYTNFAIKPDDRLAAAVGDETWLMLNEFCKFLTPVKAATTMMSGKNYPTFGMAVVVFELISKHAAKVVNQAHSRFTAEFALSFKTKLDEYDELVKSREAQIAAVLDPRAKSLLPKVVADMAVIKQSVIHEYETAYRVRFETQQLPTTSPPLNQLEEQDAALGEALYQLIDDNFGLDEPANFDGETFSSELDRWLAYHDKTMNSKTSSHEVCSWMRSLDQFPRIKMMARDFLAVMATSVPSEQAFSSAGTVVSTRRARLGDDAVAAISEMKSFLEFNEATMKLESDKSSQ
ncbi:hypothetical protein PR003_g28901 [Phytophthora rubi]|uniref:BED-type domain-containing protein n=1 Tax=Phytophthora rubi TaxID=129364 RepID=A0A6A4BW31_9STRA|nr:hypothetical protein PR003_g28901 [Phytophthora rubi]